MVATTPSTRRPPTTKQETWEAAKANGWGGSYRKPVCPDCQQAADKARKDGEG
jgi:hypothetical protein